MVSCTAVGNQKSLARFGGISMHTFCLNFLKARSSEGGGAVCLTTPDLGTEGQSANALRGYPHHAHDQHIGKSPSSAVSAKPLWELLKQNGH